MPLCTYPSAAFSFYIYDEARRRPTWPLANMAAGQHGRWQTWPLAARRAVILTFKTLQNVKILKCSHFEKKMPVLGTSEYQCIRIFALISMWLADDQRKAAQNIRDSVN